MAEWTFTSLSLQVQWPWSSLTGVSVLQESTTPEVVAASRPFVGGSPLKSSHVSLWYGQSVSSARAGPGRARARPTTIRNAIVMYQTVLGIVGTLLGFSVDNRIHNEVNVIP